MKRFLVQLTLIVAMALSVVPTASFANNVLPGLPTSKNSPCPKNSVPVSIGVGANSAKCVGDSANNPIEVYLKDILLFLSGIVGLVIVIAYIIAGYEWMTSTGSPDRLKKAKTRIGQATLSLLLFIFMYAILSYLVPGLFTS